MKKLLLVIYSMCLVSCACLGEEKKDMVEIGSYQAQLIDAEWGDKIQTAVDGKTTAGHNITGAGIEYVADHDTQGFAQCIWNDELKIYRANGKEDTFRKISYYEKPLNDNTWMVDGIDIYKLNEGDLLTQVCRGEGLYWAFWEKTQ